MKAIPVSVSLCSVWCTPLWLGPQQLACGSGTQHELYLSQYEHQLSDLKRNDRGYLAVQHKAKHFENPEHKNNLYYEQWWRWELYIVPCRNKQIQYSVRIFLSFQLPANAMQTCSSRAHIFRTVLSSCSFATDFFSTPRTTMSFPRIPTFMTNGLGGSIESLRLINWKGKISFMQRPKS